MTSSSSTPASHTLAFPGGPPLPREEARALLGGKGASLAEMAALGLPVPPGFTITTEAWRHYAAAGERWDETLWEDVLSRVSEVEAWTGRCYGDPDNPLLLSVCAGAPVSMPGLEGAALYLGLNEESVAGLARRSGDARFAWDSYRRFIEGFGDVVLGVHHARLARAAAGAGLDREDLDVDGLAALCGLLKDVVRQFYGPFPDDAREQLRLAIMEAWRCYNTPRARYYRKSHGLAQDLGVAVTVMAMVFGNKGEGSGAGWCSTRDPRTGQKKVVGGWMPGAQGEEVPSGGRPPWPLCAADAGEDGATPLSVAMPEVHAELDRIQARLEWHFQDMLDVDFAIEDRQLYVLGARIGKRSPAAGVRIAVDLVGEGLIDVDTALLRVSPEALEMALRPVLDPEAPRVLLARGMDASPGAARGVVVFDPEEAVARAEREEEIILVRLETGPEDMGAMTVARGLLTSRGGQTSHAAVVSRGMGKPCVVGCTDITIDYGRQLFYTGDSVVRRGDWITIDGEAGEVYLGRLPFSTPTLGAGPIATLLGWARVRSPVRVQRRVASGAQAEDARRRPVSGVGLYELYLAASPSEAERLHFLELLLCWAAGDQARADRWRPAALRSDAGRVLREADRDLVVLLEDTLPQEAIPRDRAQIELKARELGVRPELVGELVGRLAQENPLLGHRGLRLGLTHPELVSAQVRAVLEAAVDVAGRFGPLSPGFAIPMLTFEAEQRWFRQRVEAVAVQVSEELGIAIRPRVGAVIDTPRGASIAGRLALEADFLLFDGHRLTTLLLGLAPDDMGRLFMDYLREGVLKDSPFATLDLECVGATIRAAAAEARRAKPGIRLCWMWTDTMDPGGLRLAISAGFDTLFVSPVPAVTLLALAQEAIRADPACSGPDGPKA